MRLWTMGRGAFAFVALILAGCATAPAGVPLDAALAGTWVYVKGEPIDDPLLDWSLWPDAQVTIDVEKGFWSVQPRPGTRSVLPPQARVTRVADHLLTLVPVGRSGDPFQIYYRMVEGRLEFWWGDHADWLKPRVIYRHL
jgi:hypothetical protein